MRKPTISPSRTSPTESRKQPPSERSVTRALWASVEVSHIASRLTRSLGFARRSSIVILRGEFLFGILQMKLMHQAVRHGRQQQPHEGDENDTTEKRVNGSKYFRARISKRINRSHAAQDHRRFEQRIDPVETGKPMVAADSDEQHN